MDRENTIEYQAQAADLKEYRESSRSRTAKWRAKRQAAGCRNVTITLSPDAYRALRDAKDATGDSFSAVVERMLTAGGDRTAELTAQAQTIESLRKDKAWLERELDRKSEEIGHLTHSMLGDSAEPPERSNVVELPATRADGHQARKNAKLSKPEMLERIEALLGDGLTMAEVADRMNADGIATPSGRGVWKKSTVDNLRRRASK